MGSKRIPIAAAQRIAEDYDKSQVIVITWDRVSGVQDVATYGKSLKDCEEAAKGGNFIKRALGWPEDMCNATPARSRVTKKGLTKS